MKVSDNLKNSYASQYNEDVAKWRNMAAKYKAQNIIALAKTLSFKNVIEVGSGEGSVTEWLSKYNFSDNLYAVEISESGIEIMKSKNIKNLKEVLLFDGYKIPYEDNHFDLLVCSHVMEHVEHERILLREIKRISKYQIFEVPIDFSFYVDKKIKHYLNYGHINIYTPSLFRFLLKSENFNIINDICYIYPNEVFEYSLGNNRIQLYKQQLKNMILKNIPYLLGIKPNSYAVLTTKSSSQQDIKIF